MRGSVFTFFALLFTYIGLMSLFILILSPLLYKVEERGKAGFKEVFRETWYYILAHWWWIALFSLLAAVLVILPKVYVNLLWRWPLNTAGMGAVLGFGIVYFVQSIVKI